MVWWQDVEVETDVTVLEMVLASDSGPAKAVRDYEAAMVSQESERLTKAIANMDALQAWTVRPHPRERACRVIRQPLAWETASKSCFLLLHTVTAALDQLGSVCEGE
jgi:hypothetical protein